MMQTDPRTCINTIRTVRGMSAREFAVEMAARMGAWALPRGERADIVVPAEVATLDLAGGGGLVIARWIVRCPWCAGCELADPAEPWFYCLSCCNQAAGQALVAVAFPAERAEIEASLLERPDRATWAYLPGETLADIERQTAKLLGRKLPGRGARRGREG